ncbi:MAG TPA: S53 family peptidase [Streptosporangiaceae bacterium]|nr:S53 family peptidase [Streptosporangiaceae bacterium]
MTPALVPLEGSDRGPVARAEPAGDVDPAAWIELTLVTRRSAGLPRTADGIPARLSRSELHSNYAGNRADHELVAQVLTDYDEQIEITGTEPGQRRMKVAGPVGSLAPIFGAELSLVTSPAPGGAQVTHRYRTGGLSVPAELEGVVVAVLGFDDRPQARSQVRYAQPDAVHVSYTPPQVADIYQFPAATDGAGNTVAVIELGGGFSAADLDSYFSGLGIATPTVSAVSVDGGMNVAGQDPQGADGEVLLDIEVIGSVAPGAVQLVYFAPNTDQGFLDAITSAVHATPTPVAVSISWGQSESAWTAQAMNAMDATMADAVALGVTVCVAAGDNGSSDGVSGSQPHTDFPAASPHALACGGTSLHADAATGVITAETVWNDGAAGGATGGGVSSVFPLPAWQAAAGVPAAPGGGTGRGVPDVSGNADPATGYQILIDSQATVIGGTSAVAPLWAALAARLAQGLGRSVGFLQGSLYAGVAPAAPVAGMRDIVAGTNGAYSAGPGWDACTGLGVPDGALLLAHLAGG